MKNVRRMYWDQSEASLGSFRSRRVCVCERARAWMQEQGTEERDGGDVGGGIRPRHARGTCTDVPWRRSHQSGPRRSCQPRAERGSRQRSSRTAARRLSCPSPLAGGIWPSDVALLTRHSRAERCPEGGRSPRRAGPPQGGTTRAARCALAGIPGGGRGPPSGKASCSCWFSAGADARRPHGPCPRPPAAGTGRDAVRSPL